MRNILRSSWIYFYILLFCIVFMLIFLFEHHLLDISSIAKSQNIKNYSDLKLSKIESLLQLLVANGIQLIWPFNNTIQLSSSGKYKLLFLVQHSLLFETLLEENYARFNIVKCGIDQHYNSDLLQISLSARKSSLHGSLIASKNGRSFISDGGAHLQLVTLYKNTNTSFYRDPQELLWFTGFQSTCGTVATWSFPSSSGVLPKFEVIRYDFVLSTKSLSVWRPSADLNTALQFSSLTPCNKERAKQFYTLHEPDNSVQAFMFRVKGQRVLERGKRILDSLRVPFWISSGTCLGWFRQCDIVPYSNDIDFGIFIRHYDKRIIEAFENESFRLKHIFGKISDSWELSFVLDDIKLDLFFFYEDGEKVWNGGTQASTGKKFRYEFPKFSLCWSDLAGLVVRVPCPALPYVTANYGSDWFTPVKNWDWKKSPSNVKENGEWSREEWDTVVQVYDVDYSKK